MLNTDLSKNAASRRLSRTLWRVPALTWQFMSWAREMNTEVPLTSSSFSAGSPSSYSFGWQRFPIWLMSSAGSDARSCRERAPLPPRPPPESGAKSGRASTRSPTTEEGRRWIVFTYIQGKGIIFIFIIIILMNQSWSFRVSVCMYFSTEHLFIFMRYYY